MVLLEADNFFFFSFLFFLSPLFRNAAVNFCTNQSFPRRILNILNIADDMDVIKGKVPGSNWVNRPKVKPDDRKLAAFITYFRTLPAGIGRVSTIAE